MKKRYAVEKLPIGVLSFEREKRDIVRQTWGKQKHADVFFLLGKSNGEWPIEEFEEHMDLILIDMPEGYGQVI